mgnify:CR=1 FL=1
MFKAIKEFLFGKPVEATQPEAAPYKIETPEAKVESVNAQPIAEVKPAKAKKSPAKPKAEKKPAEKKTAKPKAKKAAK